MVITREEIKKEVKKHFVTRGEMKGCLKFVKKDGSTHFYSWNVEQATDFICECLNIED